MMMKTRWMILLMVAAIGVVGCSKSDEETIKDLEAAEEVADAPKEVKATDVVDVANVAKLANVDDVADVAKLANVAKMDDVLEGVTDKATAEKAKPEMESLTKEAEALKARGDELGKPEAMPVIEDSMPKAPAPKIEMPKLKLPG
jgi:hypothetical protein